MSSGSKWREHFDFVFLLCLFIQANILFLVLVQTSPGFNSCVSMTPSIISSGLQMMCFHDTLVTCLYLNKSENPPVVQGVTETQPVILIRELTCTHSLSQVIHQQDIDFCYCAGNTQFQVPLAVREARDSQEIVSKPERRLQGWRHTRNLEQQLHPNTLRHCGGVAWFRDARDY